MKSLRSSVVNGVFDLGMRYKPKIVVVSSAIERCLRHKSTACWVTYLTQRDRSIILRRLTGNKPEHGYRITS